MSLNKFIKTESNDQKMQRFNVIKTKFIADGLPANLAEYKAQEVVFTPEDLEAIKITGETNIGLRPSLNFYFDNADQIKLVAKWFNISFSQMAVKDSTMLINFLELMENTNNKIAKE